jgi:hypothetical protein
LTYVYVGSNPTAPMVRKSPLLAGFSASRDEWASTAWRRTGVQAKARKSRAKSRALGNPFPPALPPDAESPETVRRAMSRRSSVERSESSPPRKPSLALAHPFAARRARPPARPSAKIPHRRPRPTASPRAKIPHAAVPHFATHTVVLDVHLVYKRCPMMPRWTAWCGPRGLSSLDAVASCCVSRRGW